MPSLRKLAQLAGVSPSTVTRALRDDPRIGAETRRRIRTLAAQYHYVPNRPAQSRMTGRSYTLGVLVPSVMTPYSARLLAGILAHATPAGYRVIIKESHNRLSDSLAAIQTFIEQRVDGVLLDTGHLEPIPRTVILEMRSRQLVPVGLDATTVEGEVDHVHTDERTLASQAVDYLLRLGHVHLAFVGRTVNGHWVGRGQYIHQAFQQRLLSTRDFFTITDAPPYPSLPAGEILETFLAHPRPPTAIIAWEDPIAALLIKEATRRGCQVPRDLSMLGFGNLPFATLMSPTLTSFEQHPDLVAQQAFALFLARRDADEAGEHLPYRSLAIRPSLVLRESCRAIR